MLPALTAPTMQTGAQALLRTEQEGKDWPQQVRFSRSSLTFRLCREQTDAVAQSRARAAERQLPRAKIAAAPFGDVAGI